MLKRTDHKNVKSISGINRYKSVIIIVLIAVSAVTWNNVYAQDASASPQDYFIDAVSSATGTVVEGMEFYKKYGILTASFPYEKGTCWKMVIDTSSTAKVRVIRSAQTDSLWYTGMEADAQSGEALVAFQLMQGAQIIRKINTRMWIENGKIVAVEVTEKEVKQHIFIPESLQLIRSNEKSSRR